MYDEQIDKPRYSYARQHAKTAFKDCSHLFPDGFPADIEKAAEILIPGYKIIYQQKMRSNVSGLVISSEKLIGVNANHAPVRQRFTIAHEIGHIRLGHPDIVFVPNNSGINVFDREANEFAGSFLVPSAALRKAAQTIREPDQMAAHFKVSRHTLLIRLQSAKLFNTLF
jgi:Zn-dependent peptidase ImmA (M78 family)